MKKSLKFAQLILAITLLPLGVGFALYSLDKNGYFNIDSIEIVVTNLVEQKNYLQPLVQNLDASLEKNRGQSLWRLNLPKLQQEILAQAWVEDVTLSRRWPSQLRLELRVKEVKLLLMTKTGELRPMTGDGTLLPAVGVKEVPDVAVLQGGFFESRPDLRMRALQVMEQIPIDGTFSQRTISELHFDDKDGFWMTLVNQGLKVKLGQEQIPQKSRRVAQVMEYLGSRQMDARVIDANLSKKVLVRLRKDP